MNLVKWNPWREMDTFQNRINRFFDMPLFTSGWKMPSAWLDDESGVASWRPVVDIYDDDDKIVIKAELPGVDKKDIRIDLKDGVLTLSGERSFENEVKEDNYFRRERAYGKFQRAFTLPENLDPEKIKADHKDGILKIEIPKPEESKPKQITVH